MPDSAGHIHELDDFVTSPVEQELEGFSYTVSHDLAASIRHLSEFSRLLLNELGPQLTSRQLDHAEHIRVAGEHCRLMTEGLVAYSRVQQRPIKRERRDAMPAFQLAVLRLSVQVREAEAQVNIQPLGEIDADHALISTAFSHLLDNAIKFRRRGHAPRIVVSPAHDATFWRARVADNGIGVDPAFRERAFRMFQRLNAEDAYPGVGAGLAIARRAMRRLGGEVRFIDCDQGACVEIALPHQPPVGADHLQEET